jgi:hypothetical protein
MKHMSATAIREENVFEATMNAVIIYDEFDYATKANVMLARAARRADETTQWDVKPWQLDMLKLSPTADAALPEATLKALANHGEIGPVMAADGGDCEKVLAEFAKAGINVDSLAAQLQDEGAKSFVKSWNELLAVIATKSAALKQTALK